MTQPNPPTNGMTGRLLGDFVVHQQIGAGGFGAVYLAEQVSLGREAVIKIPLARADANSAFAAQFLREAQFASQLDHPYAAHIYAFGVESDGTLWTAMELVRGTPLNELLKTNGPLPLEKFVPLFDKLCEVVHTAHEQGIVHRDLKPANVMVIARAGRLLPKLLDLGIAKLTGAQQLVAGASTAASASVDADARAPATANTPSDAARSGASAATTTTGQSSATTTGESETHATRTGGDSQFVDVTQTVSAQATVGVGPTKMRVLAGDLGTQGHKSETVGTPAYMAPEQWVPSIPTDARTDVYALGILAYEVLTGRLPFAGKNSMELARAHARQSPPPLGGDLPVALDAVIATALAKKKDNRYQTAVELAAAVRKATGFDQEPVKLPTLDAQLRETLLATAPQPLAEAVSALDSVRNAHQGLSAVFQIMRVTTRLLGNLSLACWTHYGTIAERGQPDVARALGQLKRHGLDEMEWLNLAELIAVQFTDRRASAPLPELIELFCPDTSRTTSRTSDEPSEGSAVSRAMRAIIATKDHYENALAPDASTTKRLLEETMPQLKVVLAGLAWLHDYLLVVPHGETADRWMGTRRHPRPVVPLQAGAEVTDHEPMLVTQDGAPVLRLSPFFQAAAPAPGQDAEMFVLDGSGRSGARLVSMPTGFEKSDHALWGWLGTQVAIEALDSERKGNERAPYRGLAAFTADDADMFVGRERETESVANRLRITAMLGIVGPSGAGKSSFIQAGVLPALGSHWKSVIVRPGGSPLLALRTMVRGLEGLEHTSDDALAGAGLGNVLRAWAAARKQSLMLYVDQFEELFTLCHDPAERKAYVDMLLQASLSPADPIRVVFTVRDDFLLRCQQLEALRDRLVSGLQLLATPTPDDLLRILIEPARRAGYEFDDPELPAEMVQAIADMPSALPLLSFTAAQLWELRDRQASKLARKAYESLGGVGGALAQHAERVLGGMSPEAQGLVRIVFRNLVTADGTRAILTRAEALEILGNHADAETTLEALIHARLLTASEGAGSLDRIEVVHEALLSAWPRLINWRREDAEGARMRDQLRAAARQWDERGRPRGLLWRDETLTEYTIWRARNPGNLTGVEAAFGAASIAEAARSRRLRRIAISTIFASLTIGMIVSLFMFRKAEVSRAAADASREIASNQVTEGYIEQSRQAHLAGENGPALVLMREAIRRGSQDIVKEYLLPQIFDAFSDEILELRTTDVPHRFAGYTTDGKHIWAINAAGWLNIWDAATSRHHLRIKPHEGGRNAFGVGVGNIATTGRDGSIKIWNAEDGTLVASKSFESVQIDQADWVPARRAIVFSTSDMLVREWDLNTNEVSPVFTPTVDQVYSIYFTCDPAKKRYFVTTVQENSKYFSFLLSNDKITTLQNLTAEVNYAQFSHDGNYLALAAGLRILIYSTRTAKLIDILEGHTEPPMRLVWHPNDQLLASGGSDKSVRIWDLRSRSSKVLIGHQASISNLVFQDTGELLYSGSKDGTIKTWNTNQGAMITSKTHPGLVDAMELSPEGNFLSSSSAGIIKVWQMQRTKRFEVISAGTVSADYEQPKKISSTGLLARATDNGLVILDMVKMIPITLARNLDHAVGVSWSDSEELLSAVDENGNWIEVEALSGKFLRAGKLQLPSKISSLPLSGNSPIGVVATQARMVHWIDRFGSISHTLELNDVGTTVSLSDRGNILSIMLGSGAKRKFTVIDNTTKRVLFSSEQKWSDVAVSPDGEYIVAYNTSSVIVRVWHRSGRLVREFGNSSTVTSVRFGPHGTLLAIGGIDGVVSLIDIDDTSRLRTLSGHYAWITSICFSMKNSLIFVFLIDGAVHVWDAERFRRIGKMNFPDGVEGVCDPGGRAIASFSRTENYAVRRIESLLVDSKSLRQIDETICRLPLELREQTSSLTQCP